MLMKRFIISIGTLLMLGTTACRKELRNIDRPDYYWGTNFSSTFEAYWNGMNNNYLFWDIDTTNWDRVYRQYKPLFEKLNAEDSTDIRTAYTYFKEMTSGLVDGHYALGFKSPYLWDSAWIYPAMDRAMAKPEAHPLIAAEHYTNVIPAQYLDAGATTGIGRSSGGDVLAVTGTINGNILYLHFSSFFLAELYSRADNNEVKAVLQSFFSRLKNTAGLKGVIIDLRGNRGGSLLDLEFLAGRFITEPHHIGYTRAKSGNGRLDYGPKLKVFCNPNKDGIKLTVPIVSIIDFYSMSMSEMFTSAIKSMPNGHSVGENSWGGSSPIFDDDIATGGGVFYPPFFDMVYTSGIAFTDRNSQSLEGRGLKPDLTIPYDKTALDAGKDPQLEGAISLINK